jgi:hypothetical protein
MAETLNSGLRTTSRSGRLAYPRKAPAGSHEHVARFRGGDRERSRRRTFSKTSSAKKNSVWCDGHSRIVAATAADARLDAKPFVYGTLPDYTIVDEVVHFGPR